MEFPVGKVYEDSFVIIDLLLKAKTVVSDAHGIYRYCHRKDSIVETKFTEKNMDLLEAWEKNKNQIIEYFPELNKEVEFRYLWVCCYLYDKCMLNENRCDQEQELRKILKNNFYLDGDKLLLIDIADLHMNLQATLFSTNNEYNCEIAEKLFFYVIEDILSRTEKYNFKEIIFCIGGDMLNGDNLSGTTTKGTPQNSDIHYYDAYEKLCSMVIKAIDILKERCKVSVIYVMGNHDELTGFKLAKYVDAWFRDDNNVEVDYQPLPRKYKVFGKTLFCFAHDGDIKKLPMLIADEAREFWSKVDTTEVFLQHLHTEQILLEDNNIRIQRLPTISAKSKWSNDKGYSSKRQCKSFIFDFDDGLTDILYTPIKNV